MSRDNENACFAFDDGLAVCGYVPENIANVSRTMGYSECFRPWAGITVLDQPVGSGRAIGS